MRLAAFLGLPLLTSLSSLLLLPFIARTGGAAAWNSIAVGQAVGVLAALVVGLGWPLTGPGLVASASDELDRRRHYAISLVTRTLVFLCAAPLMGVVLSWSPGPGQSWTAFVMACATASAGLSPAWYCVGTGDAARIAKYDVLPRVLAALVSIPLLTTTGHVLLYPAVTLLFSLLGTLWFTRTISRRLDFDGLLISTVLQEVWALRSGAGVTVAAGVYASTPVLVASFATDPRDLAAFVSAERLYRVGQIGTTALGNSQQGWVSEHGGNHVARRRMSLMSLTALGLSGWSALALLGPWTSSALFGAALKAEFWTCFWFGLSFLLVCMTTSTGSHWLVPAGRLRAVLTSTVAGAVVGLPMMIVLAGIAGTAGAACGLAVGEVVVTAVQLRAISRLLRDEASSGT